MTKNMSADSVQSRQAALCGVALRIAFENRGKSGSGRVCYVNFAVYEKIYLITAYPKNVKENLSKSERNAISEMIKQLERALKW